jgi:hypothetical protein
LGCWLETYRHCFYKSGWDETDSSLIARNKTAIHRVESYEKFKTASSCRVIMATVFQNIQKVTVLSITEKGTTNSGAKVATLHRIWKCKKRENVRCLSFSGMIMHGCTPDW